MGKPRITSALSPNVKFISGTATEIVNECGKVKRVCPSAPSPTERIPRIARLMALAIRFEGLIQLGEAQDYADLARLGFVSRPRITQIMNLLNLAPDIQEEIMFLPRIVKGRDPITERDVRTIVATTNWSRQREMWRNTKRSELW